MVYVGMQPDHSRKETTLERVQRAETGRLPSGTMSVGHASFLEVEISLPQIHQGDSCTNCSIALNEPKQHGPPKGGDPSVWTPPPHNPPTNWRLEASLRGLGGGG